MQSNANRDASCVSPPEWKLHTETPGQNPKDFFWTLKNTTSFPLWELQAKPCDRRGEKVPVAGCRTWWGPAGRSVRSLPSICSPSRDPFGIQVLASWWREDGIGMQLCPPLRLLLHLGALRTPSWGICQTAQLCGFISGWSSDHVVPQAVEMCLRSGSSCPLCIKPSAKVLLYF